MSFRLTRKELDRRAEIVELLNDLSANIVEAVSVFNAQLDALREPVTAAVEAYNNALNDAREFAADMAVQADNDITDKSDRWHGSERGQAAIAWRDEWQNLSLDDLDLALPEAVEFDEPQHAGDLESAPESADAA